MHKPKGRRCSPERAEKIAIRAIEWLAKLGLALLLAASLVTTAGRRRRIGPRTPRAAAHPVILDEAPGHPVPIFSGPESLFLPLNRPSDPRNRQNEPKDGEVAQIVQAPLPRVVHRSDRSRGPPGARGDPSSALTPAPRLPTAGL